jgi:ribosomal-protein-alanine N-acetyltransferase
MIQLRPMSKGDVEWVLALDHEMRTAPHWSPEIYRTYPEAGEPAGVLRRFALVGEVDGVRAGIALGRLLLDGVENACEVEWIAVEPAMRRKGVGRALMEGVEGWCLKHGGLRLMLEVRAGNITAQRLYGEAGWVEVGRRRGYYKDPVEDAVLMERVPVDSGKFSTESP